MPKSIYRLKEISLLGRFRSCHPVGDKNLLYSWSQIHPVFSKIIPVDTLTSYSYQIIYITLRHQHPNQMSSLYLLFSRIKYTQETVKERTVESNE